jgi:predicted membrane protein
MTISFLRVAIVKLYYSKSQLKNVKKQLNSLNFRQSLWYNHYVLIGVEYALFRSLVFSCKKKGVTNEKNQKFIWRS